LFILFEHIPLTFIIQAMRRWSQRIKNIFIKIIPTPSEHFSKAYFGSYHSLFCIGLYIAISTTTSISTSMCPKSKKFGFLGSQRGGDLVTKSW
jgi:hypothetical protein